MGLPRAAYELQTLFGMGDAIQRALVDRGHRVRVYTPYGAILPGMAYLVRRLLENTSNESFLKASFAEQCADRRPAARSRGDRSHVDPDTTAQGADPAASPAAALPPFRNEPPTDFARAENREAMRQALEEVRLQLGRRYPLVIGGEEVHTEAATARFARPEPQLARRGPGGPGRRRARRSGGRRGPRRRSRPGRRRRPRTAPPS